MTLPLTSSEALTTDTSQAEQNMNTPLYTVVHDPRLRAVRILPSEYFLSLSPDQQGAALKNHILRLSEDLNQFERTLIARDSDMSEEKEIWRKMVLEIELAQQSLVLHRERHGLEKAKQPV